MLCRNCFLTVVSLLIMITAHAQQLVVATYNIRYDNKDDSIAGNGWRQRCPVIAQLIRFHDFDIFGTQEGKANQLHDLRDSLHNYTYIGVGRDDGKEGGEFSAIFYKKDRFQLLDKGNFWLSPITDKPNKGWDAALPRICSWGKFKETKTGFIFYFFNLHMDHIGVVARRESAKLVLDTIRKMSNGIPTVLTGDFNVDQHNESYTLINASGVLKDAYMLSPVKYALNGTFNSFNINRYSSSRIDHIFLFKAFTVQRYGVLTDSYRTSNIPAADSATGNDADESNRQFAPRLPSDHYPVMAIITYAVR